MVGSTYAQAYNSTGEEKGEGYSIGRCDGVSFKCIEREGDEEKDASTRKVRVDIDGFIVDLKQTLERSKERIGYGTVMSQDVMIVLPPGR